jgi:NAD+ synthase (glutamine-hydrolysing)
MNPLRLRIALAQINSVVGDVRANVARIRRAIAQARDAGAQVVAFPELAVCGYPLEGLPFNPTILAEVSESPEKDCDCSC